MARLLVLGAGYIGAALARRALDDGHDVVLADNWQATEREQLEELREAGATIVTADMRDGVAHLLEPRPDVVHLLAAQASRPIAERDPELTETTNLTGVRRVAEDVAAAGGMPLVFASSLNVYGSGLTGEVRADRPYGPQGDLAHLSKVYGELCLRMYAARAGFPLSLLRLGIVYGPSPVEHSDPASQTVVDKFRRLAGDGRPLTLDDGGSATIGVVHVADVARILLEHEPEPLLTANIAAETITVADLARLARGEPAQGGASWTVDSPFEYDEDVAGYLA
jgi:nucleoside-diphosphate-sugar epimerase